MAKSRKDQPARRHLSRAELDALIDEALVDAYGESEQRTAFFSVLEDHVVVPFEVEILGVSATVERLDLTADEVIVARCRRGPGGSAVSASRQGVPPLRTPHPHPPPQGGRGLPGGSGVPPRRGTAARQSIPLLDLVLPDPPPAGWEWIEAYRHWARGH